MSSRKHCLHGDQVFSLPDLRYGRIKSEVAFEKTNFGSRVKHHLSRKAAEEHVMFSANFPSVACFCSAYQLLCIPVLATGQAGAWPEQ